MYCVMTRTLACGMLQRLREALRALMHPCVDTHAVSLSPSHSHTRAVRFETHVRDHVRGVRRFDDVGGGFEAGVEIAGLVGVGLPRVAVGEHGGRVRRHRRLALGRKCGSRSYSTRERGAPRRARVPRCRPRPPRPDRPGRTRWAPGSFAVSTRSGRRATFRRRTDRSTRCARAGAASARSRRRSCRGD